MRCTEEKLIEMLKELHEYYWNLGKKLHASDSKNPKHCYDCYAAGKAEGALEAVDVILLQVIGGKALYEILENNWSNG